MARSPATSKVHPRHKACPYQLRGVAVTRPNQVWSTDPTYIRLAHGFAYLAAILDWYSRRVLAWRVSNSMDASFCVDCPEDALRHHDGPEVYNAERPHQALGYETPDHVYRAGAGGGALIVDRLGDADSERREYGGTGQRRAAAGVEMDTT
jgi:putative transposase